MNVIIAGNGSWPGFADTVMAYRNRSMCLTHVISDRADVLPDACFTRFHFGAVEEILLRWDYMPTMRWLVVNQYVKENGLTGPLYCPDWDMMGFSDMTTACEPFFGYDAGWCSTDTPGHGAFSFFGSEKVLDDYVAFTVQRIMDSGGTFTDHTFHDMVMSEHYAKERGVKVADMAQIVNGSTFDGNIHTGTDVFKPEVVDGQTVKRVVWSGGHPFFVEQATGNLVLAHIIHCWGTYKSKTAELLKLAEIP